MEFFERAHVVKSASKDKKSEVMKKQFKQMLYGYKNSNNEIIKESVNDNNDFDDSSSVSGFSDLNITNSSDDNFDESELDQTYNSSIEKDQLSLDCVVKSDTKKSSECSSSTDSIIKESNSPQDDSNSVISEDISLGSCVETSSECSESFDPNGELAGKILSQLNRKVKKRKLQNRGDSNSASEADSVIEDIPDSIKRKIKDDMRMSNIGRQILQDIEEEAELSDSIENISECESSLPYISISAADMPSQSFNDVLGNYKHSTNKNLSLENGEMTAAATDVFIEETMNVEVHTEEDVSSLVPELDDEPTVDDIVDLESTNLCDESTNICETTIESPKHDMQLSIDEELMKKNLNIFYTSNKCVIVLKHPMELYIQGKVKLQSLGGKVEVFGFTLQDNCYNLYAPYYSYAQRIKTVASDNCYYGLFGKLTKCGLTVSEAEQIVTTLGTNDAVISFEQLHCKKENFVDTNFTLSNLFVKPYKHNDPYLSEPSDKMGCSMYMLRPQKHFVENPIWSQCHQAALKNCSRGVICGGKNVGKSTYVRYQANRLLEKGPVLVIDLDPAQCEFTVAGNVSATVVNEPLLGPNFTHLTKPELMLNIGIINTMDNLSRYICAVQRLIFYCYSRDEYKNMPWLINTMGMTNSLGMKIMILIILMIKPTYLVQYNSKAVKKCFAQYLNMETVKWFFADNKRDFLFRNHNFPQDLDYSFILVEESAKPGKSSYSLTAKDERFLNYLAYFSQFVSLYKTENLLSIIPYKISLSKMSVGSNVKIKSECILRVINGKIVALCAHPQVDKHKVFTLSDKPLVCYGNGLVRGVDLEKELMYILTPVPRDQLTSVNCFVYADWSPDIGIFENYLPNGTAVPYCTKAQKEHSHLMMTPRRRFNPLQLLNVTRSS